MTAFLTLVQAANIEDTYLHLVFLNYLVSMEEDSVGRTFSSMIASPSWLPVFQKQMENTSVHWQIQAIDDTPVLRLSLYAGNMHRLFMTRVLGCAI